MISCPRFSAIVSIAQLLSDYMLFYTGPVEWKVMTVNMAGFTIACVTVDIDMLSTTFDVLKYIILHNREQIYNCISDMINIYETTIRWEMELQYNYVDIRDIQLPSASNIFNKLKFIWVLII